MGHLYHGHVISPEGKFCITPSKTALKRDFFSGHDPIFPACQAKGQHDAYGNGQCSPGALDTKEFGHDVDTWARRRRNLILPENWWCLTNLLGRNKDWFGFNFNLNVLLYHSTLMGTTSISELPNYNLSLPKSLTSTSKKEEQKPPGIKHGNGKSPNEMGV